MSDVVNIEANLPHYVGHAVCCECGHYWVSVFPTTATALECPGCRDFPTVRVFLGDITEVKLFGGSHCQAKPGGTVTMMDLDKLEKAVKLLDELGVGATLVMQYAEAKDLLDEAREESITAQEMFELHENAMMDEASKQMRYHLNTVRQLMNTIDEEV